VSVEERVVEEQPRRRAKQRARVAPFFRDRRVGIDEPANVFCRVARRHLARRQVLEELGDRVDELVAGLAELGGGEPRRRVPRGRGRLVGC
jgi:hypothetical protein